MSKTSRQQKIEVIRNETREQANTRGRVADILTDLNNLTTDENALNTVNVGAIVTTSNQVILTLSNLGYNEAIIDGVSLKKYTASEFSYTPVVSTVKILKVYAINDADIFHLAEGVESSEAKDPTIPTNSLLVTTITVTVDGQEVTQNELSSYAKRDASNLSNVDVIKFRNKLNITDVGKVDTVMNVAPDANKNVDISNVAMNWKNPSQKFSALPNKSVDATFTRWRVQDDAGSEAYVTNPYKLLKAGLTTMTTAEALEISQLLNGGAGSAGAISVNLISPPIVQSQFDSQEYILLQGVNLNLSATAKKIEILASDKTTVVTTIPDNQIQLYSDGAKLIFYYNFHNYSNGTYFIRITSGVKVYITTLDLKVVQSVENINLENISWDIYYTQGVIPNPSNNAQGSSTVIITPVGVGAIPKISLKSSEIFAEGEDFYIEMKINLSSKWERNTDGNQSFIGIGYSNTINGNGINSLIYGTYHWQWEDLIVISNNGELNNQVGSPIELTMKIIKTGNLFRTEINNTITVKTISNNSGYSLFQNIVGRRSEQVVQTKIIKAYKFY